MSAEGTELDVDRDVVECAALAHDVGHPPFGHTGENELDRLVRADEPDGFEGNAQTFRIITRLAEHNPFYEGLNLTRATLNATLKYPRYRNQSLHKKGVYSSESIYFEWAQQYHSIPNSSTAEAMVVEWADDISYAIHDFEDFYKSGLIPLQALTLLPEERERFLNATVGSERIEPLARALSDVLNLILIDGPYSGSREVGARLQATKLLLTKRYVDAIGIERGNLSTLSVNSEKRNEIQVLKLLTCHYVHNNPALAAQRVGYRNIVRSLYTVILEALQNRQLEPLPPRFRERANAHYQSASLMQHDTPERLAADFVAELTDQQALRLHRRLTGTCPGRFSDTIL